MTDQKRRYRMNARAESQRATRLRITEAAVELHGTLGPSRTSMSAVAEHAGVERSTLYRHFPDEGKLFEACSAHWRGFQHPLPDLDRWRTIDDPCRAVAHCTHGALRVLRRSRAHAHEHPPRRRFTGSPCGDSSRGSWTTWKRPVRRCWPAGVTAVAPYTRCVPPSGMRSPSRRGVPSSANKAAPRLRRSS